MGITWVPNTVNHLRAGGGGRDQREKEKEVSTDTGSAEEDDRNVGHRIDFEVDYPDRPHVDRGAPVEAVKQMDKLGPGLWQIVMINGVIHRRRAGAGNGVPLDSARFRAAMRHLRDKEAPVIEASTVTLVIDYPLTKEYRETLSSETGAFSREQLCIHIALAYENIYDEERRTSTLPEETVRERDGSVLLNRAPTNGTYGIDKHVLTDLLLHTVIYHPDKNEIHVEAYW